MSEMTETAPEIPESIAPAPAPAIGGSQVYQAKLEMGGQVNGYGVLSSVHMGSDSVAALEQAGVSRERIMDGTLTSKLVVASPTCSRIADEIAKQGVIWDEMRLKDQAKLIRFSLRGNPCVIDPQSNFMQYWDLLSVLALTFCAIFTPFEAAFLETGTSDPLFWLNRLVDLFFYADMAINFFLMYRKEEVVGGMFSFGWERNLKLIRGRYLKNWFWLDLVSVLPYDLVALSLKSAFVQKMRMLRLLRLVRMAKLLRLIKASHLFRRFEVKCEFSYNAMHLAKSFIALVLSTHWLSCLWGLIGRVTDQMYDDSWISTKSGDDGAGGMKLDSAIKVYIASVYWAAMTITSIGYGDITAQYIPEYICSVFGMLVGGMLWAYLIGSACGIISSLNRHSNDFALMMDELRGMCSERRIPRELRMRLRFFLHSARQSMRMVEYEQLSQRLSPALSGECSLHVTRQWLVKPWIFRDVEPSFLVEISQAIESSVHAPRELVGFREPSLGLLESGILSYRDRIVMRGGIWGEDFVILRTNLVRSESALALTHVSLYSLKRSKLHSIAKCFPLARQRVKHACAVFTLSRLLVQCAKDYRTLVSKGVLNSDCSTSAMKMDFNTIERHLPRLPNGLIDFAKMREAVGTEDTAGQAAADIAAGWGRVEGNDEDAELVSTDVEVIEDKPVEQTAPTLARELYKPKPLEHVPPLDTSRSGYDWETLVSTTVDAHMKVRTPCSTNRPSHRACNAVAASSKCLASIDAVNSSYVDSSVASGAPTGGDSLAELRIAVVDLASRMQSAKVKQERGLAEANSKLNALVALLEGGRGMLDVPGNGRDKVTVGPAAPD